MPLQTRDDKTGRLRSHRADDAVDQLERDRGALRDAGRHAVGITGEASTGSLRGVLRDSGVSAYPVVALSLLAMVDQLQSTALTILGPEITAALGIPRGAFGAAVLVRTLVVTLAMVPLAAAVQRRARRATVCIITAYAWSVLTGLTGFVVSVWGLMLFLALAGAATASVLAIHQPLLLDSFPPAVRVRVLSIYRAANGFGDVLGPLLLGASVVLLDLTWRGVFLTAAAAALVASVVASRLRDPGFGRWDADQVRAVVHADSGVDPEVLHEESAQLGFFEITRRVLLIPTIRRLLAANAVLGMFLVPLTTYLAFFLQERWGMGPGARAVFTAAMPIFAIVALQLFGRRGEAMFQQDPARLVRLSAWLMAIGVTVLALGIFAPVFALMVGLVGIALGLLTVTQPAISMAMLSVVPSTMRPHVAALSGIALAGVGGTAGLMLLGGIDRRFGTAGAIASLALPGIAAGLVLRGAARTVNGDLDRMVDEIIEEEEIRAISSSGGRLPMLACRHVDFSYGQVQVLFDVNFTVDDGEMVALLGTNGAGKSTLMRVISGLGLPSRGSVRYRGVDVTYLDAERRVGLGISQVPGGRAVFGPMTVVDNLRVLGHVHGRNKRAIDRGMDACFEAFPRLAERRNQLASTLSGGEQQMLGLSTAFIAKPQLLLIDELSLGLAPKIVGELLGMVRQINSTGTSVVLIEQSVNVALSLVEHAYFMEKGEIRFDGAAADLLARPDLLRSVFLDGASKGLAAARTNGHSAT